MESNGYDVSGLSSNHEEADTSLILHASHASNRGQTVHILSPDTDVVIRAIRRQLQLGDNTCMIVGTGEKCRIVPIKQVYDAIGPIIGRFSRIHGLRYHWKVHWERKGHVLKHSKSCQTECLQHWVSRERQTIAGHNQCTGGVCVQAVLSTVSIVNISALRWYQFKKNQAEAEKRPLTRATLRNHIQRVHYQAMIWVTIQFQSLYYRHHSTMVGLWMAQPTHSSHVRLAPAPSAVVELV